MAIIKTIKERFHFRLFLTFWMIVSVFSDGGTILPIHDGYFHVGSHERSFLKYFFKYFGS